MNTVTQRRLWWIGGHVLLFTVLPLSMAGCPQAGNHPPTANAGADQVVNTGASVTLNGSGSSDPDGNALTFFWEQKLGTPVALSSTSAAVVTFTAPASGTYLVFEMTVSDGKSSAVGKANVSVRPVELSAQIDEVLQRSVTEDPAAMGDFPNGWLVERPDAPPTPPDGSEIEEFKEQWANTKFAPVIEEDLLPGASRTVEVQVAGPSGLSGSVRWIGTASPLDVALVLDGSILAATGNAFQSGSTRGGTLLKCADDRGRARHDVRDQYVGWNSEGEARLGDHPPVIRSNNDVQDYDSVSRSPDTRTVDVGRGTCRGVLRRRRGGCADYIGFRGHRQRDDDHGSVWAARCPLPAGLSRNRSSGAFRNAGPSNGLPDGRGLHGHTAGHDIHQSAGPREDCSPGRPSWPSTAH